MAVIRKTRSGKFELDVYIAGKRKRFTFNSKREAEDAKREYLFGSSDEDGLEPKAIKDAMRAYSDHVSVGKAAKETEGFHFDHLYKFLRSEGLVMMHEITPLHMEAYKSHRLSTPKKGGTPGETIKASTVRREFNTIKHFFRTCVEWKAMKSNPASETNLPTVKKNPRRVWTDAEFKAVVATLPEWAAHVLTAMYWLGAGPAELSRVRWLDIDPDKRTIRLKRYKGTGDEITRVIPMPTELVELLNAKLQMAMTKKPKAKADDLVFMNSRGKALDARQLNRLVSRRVDDMGLPQGTVPYGLRHKFATELLEANVGEDQVRRLMGHRSVRTLIENYSHVRESALREAIDVRSKTKLTGSNNDENNGSGGR